MQMFYLFFIAILHCILPQIAAGQERFPYMGIVTTEKLRVMPQKGTNYMEIAELAEHDLVTVVDREGDWLRIKPPEDIVCWISKDFVKNGEITGNAVNVRSGPGIEHRILGQVNMGDHVVSIEEKDTWIHIAAPDNLTAYVKADFIKYFSTMGNMDAQLRKLKESKELFDAAVIYAKNELQKTDFKAIDFDLLKDKFYSIIRSYSETVQAKKSLYYLNWIEEERKKREEQHREEETQRKLKTLFAIAEDHARKEMAKENFKLVDVDTIITNYLAVIKSFPKSNEADWSVDRIAYIQEKITKMAEKDLEKRQLMLYEAEQYREAQLLKEVSEIDYFGIMSKYREISVLFPDTPEAKQAIERIQDIQERQKFSQAKMTKGDSVMSFHSFEGILVLESKNTEAGDLYRVEEKQFLSRKTLCYFYTLDKKIEIYENKRVFVEGIISSFDKDNNPIIDLTRIQRR